ncbi:MAG: glycerophosphodiester phosphodiesterase [Rhodospirillaceae bacterium]|nr:glycerophosphodiester phosphodiesterase [Rhodospirillaceae bacterium]MDD9996933.1 glycerophosphodiester phosphodiesterase [Rhodospirillaceae bacterium]MDE0363256.1 glycerophosphodiester phosphodiesterase [Rhodospirillaceae bacterium]
MRNRFTVARTFALFALILQTGCTAFTEGTPAAHPEAAPKPLVIAHRGASGYLPEHTLQAYALAIEQGAHYIEMDLVITADGVLIARHENELSDTTDVAENFPDRRRTRLVDGQQVDGWFSEDFTLEEIKTLRATERLPFRDQSSNGKFQVPSFDEVIQLALSRSRELGRRIGIYPETKHPSYFAALGLPLEEPLVAALEKHDLNRADAPVFIQSFEISNLRKLDGLTDAPLIQLLSAPTLAPFDQESAGSGLTYGDMITDAGLREIATYADGIGPWKTQIVPRDEEGNLAPPTNLIDRAHAVGLAVHAYTFRSEARYLARQYDGDPGAEYRQYFSLGVDGVFTDFPDAATRAARNLQ